jgi:hypothetical protein
MPAKCFLLMLLCFLTALSGCSAGVSREPEPEMQVTPLVGIGKVRFGMSEEEVINILGEPDKRRPRCLIYRRLGLSVVVHPKLGLFSLACFTKKAIPWWDRFSTNDFRGATKEGIGMGSSEEQVIKPFGKPDERNDQGRQVILTYKELGLSLVLLSNKVIQFWMRIPSKPIDTSTREPNYARRATR